MPKLSSLAAPALLALAGLTCSANAQLVLNEVLENPPNGGDQTWEYIEIYGPPGMSLTGYAVACLKGGQDVKDNDTNERLPDGDGRPDGDHIPEVDEAFCLDGWSIGPDGLFVIYNADQFGFSSIRSFLMPNCTVVGNCSVVTNCFRQFCAEGPTNKRYFNGASFQALHLPSTDVVGKLENENSSTYVIVRRRPNYALNQNGTSFYGPGYTWRKDVAIDANYDGRLDFGDEAGPLYLQSADNGAQTTPMSLEPAQIIDEVAWSNNNGKEYHRHWADNNRGKFSETPSFNPDAFSRVRYLSANPHAGYTIDHNSQELKTTSTADESFIYGDCINVNPGTPDYGIYKSNIEPGLDGILGTADDEGTHGAPTNPNGQTYSMASLGGCSPDAAPFSCPTDPAGALRFNDYDMSGFRLTPGQMNDAPAGSALIGTPLEHQMRFVRGDFNFDGIVDCADRALIEQAATEGWKLDDTAQLLDDRDNDDPSDDRYYTGYRWEVAGFNGVLAMIRMNLVDGSTGEWNSGQVLDASNRIVAWGGAVTQADLAAWITENPSVVCSMPGCTADFNCDGDFGTDADIEAFFACLAGNCPPSPCANNSDFNADGDFGTDADIESFFRVLAGGSC